MNFIRSIKINRSFYANKNEKIADILNVLVETLVWDEPKEFEKMITKFLNYVYETTKKNTKISKLDYVRIIYSDDFRSLIESSSITLTGFRGD